LKRIAKKLKNNTLSPLFGLITKISSTIIEVQGLNPGISDIVEIVREYDSSSELGMVTEVRGEL